MTRAPSALSAALLACGPTEGTEPLAVDPGSAPPCSMREVLGADGRCRCPSEDVLCPTRGYAHFPISNAEESGLPNEATYAVTEGLVRDRVTALVWQRVASTEAFTFQGAREYCDALEIEGRRDFRLPGRIELVTLLDFARLPVIASPFAAAKADYYFTSSLASFVYGSVYSVYFGAGETTIASAEPGRALARCVAGPVERREQQFRIDGDWVRDGATGLTWERASAEPASWDASRARCAARSMRLPSIRELQSIVDENRYMPAIDSELFPAVEATGFWSVTLRGDAPWYVDFSDGKTFADRLPNEPLPSRCVH